MAKKKSEIIIKYIGPGDQTQVIGLGVFKKDQSVTFKGDQIQAAEKLLATNINFKEAEK